MLMLDAEQTRTFISMPALIEALRTAFAQHHVTPPRQVVSAPGGDGDRLLLSMPSFAPEGSGIVKLATVFPDNPRHGAPTIQGVLVLFSNRGAPIAIDGWRRGHPIAHSRSLRPRLVLLVASR